jgi:hypothetical protein
MAGDFDLDGSFTLNDAATVAEAQFGKAYLPWQIPELGIGNPNARQLQAPASDGVGPLRHLATGFLKLLR